MAILSLIGSFLLLGGAFFLFLGALGLLRMPDFFNRIQAGTKATTLGTMLSLIGIACLHPDWWAKLAVIAGFILLTNPVSSHVLARAAHASSFYTKKMERDDLRHQTGEEEKT